jgi:dehydrogenase/reductase SDR family protein 12
MHHGCGSPPLAPPAGVSFYSMHPGWSDTEGVRSSIPGFHAAFKDKLRDTQQGVDTILWLALEVGVVLLRGWFRFM